MNRIFAVPLIATVALVLSACASEDGTGDAAAPAAKSEPTAADEPVAAAEAKSVIALDGEGLRLVNVQTGSSRLLAFGTDRTATEKAVAGQLGSPGGRSSNAECGAGPIDFTDFGEFTINFQDDRFVGWSLGGTKTPATLTTMSGVGIGTTKSEMENTLAVDIDKDSTIGTEFHTAGFSGLLEKDAADAKVTDLWAGINCIFR